MRSISYGRYQIFIFFDDEEFLKVNIFQFELVLVMTTDINQN
jgi:hypothetical protein